MGIDHGQSTNRPQVSSTSLPSGRSDEILAAKETNRAPQRHADKDIQVNQVKWIEVVAIKREIIFGEYNI